MCPQPLRSHPFGKFAAAHLAACNLSRAAGLQRCRPHSLCTAPCRTRVRGAGAASVRLGVSAGGGGGRGSTGRAGCGAERSLLENSDMRHDVSCPSGFRAICALSPPCHLQRPVEFRCAKNNVNVNSRRKMATYVFACCLGGAGHAVTADGTCYPCLADTRAVVRRAAWRRVAAAGRVGASLPERLRLVERLHGRCWPTGPRRGSSSRGSWMILTVCSVGASRWLPA